MRTLDLLDGSGTLIKRRHVPSWRLQRLRPAAAQGSEPSRLEARTIAREAKGLLAEALGVVARPAAACVHVALEDAAMRLIRGQRRLPY